jgi:antitoxin ParD1/3/4
VKIDVELTDFLARFVEANVESGRFQDVSEVVREALRLLETRRREEAARLERLRDALRVGEDAIARGDYRDISVNDLDDLIAGLDEAARSTPAA